MSSPSQLHRLATQAFDDRYKSKYSESFLRQQEHIIWVSRNITLRTQYLHLGVFLSKQYIILPNYKDLQVAKFSFMYSFTHTNIVFLFRHLPTEIVNFINVVTRWSVSVVIVFPFLGAGFANIPPTFLISYEVQTRYLKTLEYSDQYVKNHLSDTKARIWICF